MVEAFDNVDATGRRLQARRSVRRRSSTLSAANVMKQSALSEASSHHVVYNPLFFATLLTHPSELVEHAYDRRRARLFSALSIGTSSPPLGRSCQHKLWRQQHACRHLKLHRTHWVPIWLRDVSHNKVHAGRSRRRMLPLVSLPRHNRIDGCRRKALTLFVVKLWHVDLHTRVDDVCVHLLLHSRALPIRSSTLFSCGDSLSATPRVYRTSTTSP